jgi:hypothetical protein
MSLPLKASLLCFILCGIRTLACPRRIARAKAVFHALNWCSRALKGLFIQFQANRFLSTLSLPACNPKAGGSCNPLCSSLPLEFPLPIHAVAPDSTSRCQEEPTVPFIQDAPAEVNMNQPVTRNTPQFQLHIASELTFEVRPLVRAFPSSVLFVFNAAQEPHPITTFQLVPPRRPISKECECFFTDGLTLANQIFRSDPSDIDKIYSHPRMSSVTQYISLKMGQTNVIYRPENAAQGYIPSYTTDYTP